MAVSVGKGILKGAAIISAFTVVGRLMGFVQKLVMAHFFGTGHSADAFTLAFSSVVFTAGLFPQQLVNPFLPLFAEKREKEGPAAAWRSACSVGTILLVAMVAVAAAGLLLAPLLVSWTSSFKDSETTLLVVRLVRVMMPAVVFMGLSSLLALLLNAYKNFAMAAFGDTVNKLVMIACLILLYYFSGIYGLAAGVVAGAVSGLAIQVFGLRRYRPEYRFGVDWKDPALRQLFFLMLPVLFSVAVAQLRTIIDYKFASGMAEGSAAGINYARGLTDTLILLVPTAVGAAIYPFFSDMSAARDRAGLTDTLMRALRLLAFLFIPLTVALVLLGEPLVQLAFQRGKFTAESVSLTVAPLTYYAFGLTAFALEIILMRFYFSMKNTLVPALVGAFCVLIHWGVILLFKDTLQNGSMALAASVSKTAKVLILFVFLARVLPGLQWRRNGLFLLKAGLGAAGMAAAMLLALKGTAVFLDPGAGGTLARLLMLAAKMGVAGVAGLLAYAGLAYLLRMEEAKAIADLARRRRKP
jgi:murein biosynthesis integral membrane protein MurJ